MTKRFDLPQKKPGGWQWLIGPMLLASLGLHALVLMVPVGPSDQEALPAPDLEQDNISITRIPPTASPAQRTAASAPTTTALARPAQTAAARPAQRPSTAANRADSNRSRPRQESQRVRSRPSTSPSPPALSSPSSPTSASSAPSQVPLSPPTPRAFNPTIHQRLLAHAQTLTRSPVQIAQLATGLMQQYTYSPENTSSTDLNTNLSRWIETVRQATGQPNLGNEPLEPPLTLKVQRRVCLIPPPQPAMVGAVVSPSGALQGEPTLLQSSGYGFLNAAILAAIPKTEFPAAGEQKAYTLTVTAQVDYGPLDCLKPYPRP